MCDFLIPSDVSLCVVGVGLLARGGVVCNQRCDDLVGSVIFWSLVILCDFVICYSLSC